MEIVLKDHGDCVYNGKWLKDLKDGQGSLKVAGQIVYEGDFIKNVEQKEAARNIKQDYGEKLWSKYETLKKRNRTDAMDRILKWCQ